MSGKFSLACILLPLSFVAWAANTQPEKETSRRPFFDARKRQANYEGPGREKSPPTDVNEILIGYFGPSTPSHPQAGEMWRAACLAIEQANRAGGYRGLPFRLVAAWSENPWGSGVKHVVRMAYIDKVWAIIGGIDGPSTHLAEQVVAKARLTLLNPASTDKTINLANVPWMFSCIPADHLQAPALADAISLYAGPKHFLLVSATDHDSHVLTVELKKSFTRRQIAPSHHFEFERRNQDYTKLAEKIMSTNVDTLVLIAGARDSARLISAVRKKGFKGYIFGGPSMGRRRFLSEAGRASEGVIFPLLYTPAKHSDSFEKQFASRFGAPPDYRAAYTYDAVNLLVAAIRKAGLNRARIRDLVRELSPFSGVTGTIKWDKLGANSQPVRLGAISAGRVIPASAPSGLGEQRRHSSRR